MNVLRSGFALPKIYQFPDVVLTKHVIVEWFSDSFVIRREGKLILQKDDAQYEKVPCSMQEIARGKNY